MHVVLSSVSENTFSKRFVKDLGMVSHAVDLFSKSL